jgi:hypothetical protein
MNVTGQLMFESFKNWAGKDVKYKKIYKTVPGEVMGIPQAAFGEMPEIKPAAFDEWWLRNHMRYYGKFTQINVNKMRELVLNFLVKYVRNELGESKERPSKRRGAQTLKQP